MSADESAVLEQRFETLAREMRVAKVMPRALAEVRTLPRVAQLSARVVAALERVQAAMEREEDARGRWRLAQHEACVAAGIAGLRAELSVATTTVDAVKESEARLRARWLDARVGPPPPSVGGDTPSARLAAVMRSLAEVEVRLRAAQKDVVDHPTEAMVRTKKVLDACVRDTAAAMRAQELARQRRDALWEREARRCAQALLGLTDLDL